MSDQGWVRLVKTGQGWARLHGWSKLGKAGYGWPSYARLGKTGCFARSGVLVAVTMNINMCL
jgi:hypothetical protein